MNETKIFICIIGALFLLIICMFCTANYLSQKISGGWSLAGSFICGMVAATFFMSALLRQNREAAEARRLHEAEMEALTPRS